jgi:thymidylate kinase
MLATGQLRQPDLYILLSCSTEISIARQNKTNGPVWSNELFLENAHAFYIVYLEQTGRPYLTIDTTMNSADDVMKKIDSAIYQIRN